MAPVKMARRLLSNSASSKAVEAWVTVTSLSTPSEPMMNPASSSEVRVPSSAALVRRLTPCAR
jgi:hypothetical protein